MPKANPTVWWTVLWNKSQRSLFFDMKQLISPVQNAALKRQLCRTAMFITTFQFKPKRIDITKLPHTHPTPLHLTDHYTFKSHPSTIRSPREKSIQYLFFDAWRWNKRYTALRLQQSKILAGAATHCHPCCPPTSALKRPHDSQCLSPFNRRGTSCALMTLQSHLQWLNFCLMLFHTDCTIESTCFYCSKFKQLILLWLEYSKQIF